MNEKTERERMDDDVSESPCDDIKCFCYKNIEIKHRDSTCKRFFV